MNAIKQIEELLARRFWQTKKFQTTVAGIACASVLAGVSYAFTKDAASSVALFGIVAGMFGVNVGAQGLADINKEQTMVNQLADAQFVERVDE